MPDWDGLTQAERDVVTYYREALDLWRLGTERPDAAFHNIADRRVDQASDDEGKLHRISILGCVEAGRLESVGDFAGAWSWYRAAFRWSRHAARHANHWERLFALKRFIHVSARAKLWASQPGVDAFLLRRALDDIQAIDALTPRNSEAIKIEYLLIREGLDRPGWAFDLVADADARAHPGPWRAIRRGALRARFALLREPERSRRIYGRIIANLLPHCDRPASARPALVGTDLRLYPDDPALTPAPGAISPGELEAWYRTSLVLPHLWSGSRDPVADCDIERRSQAGLVVHLASELHRRERGRPPASVTDLVGPYLQAIPDGYVSPPRSSP